MIYAVNAFSGEKGWAWLVVQISTGAVVYLAIVLMLNISNIRNDAKEFLAPKINKLLKK
jgi:superoxide dismutase